VAINLGRWGAFLERREGAMRRLRAAGDPRAADATGWLALAGVLLDANGRLLRRLLGATDPGAYADQVATASDAAGPLRREGDGPPRHWTTPCGFKVADAGSRSGWLVADLAGKAAAGKVLVVAGSPLSPSAARTLLRRRLAAGIPS